MDGCTVKIPKHKHVRDLFHPTTSKLVCWCEYPFSIAISELKRAGRDVTLIAIYEIIQADKRIRGKQRSVQLDNFLPHSRP